jgi:Ni,Fe-hydrogenase maturation factor
VITLAEESRAEITEVLIAGVGWRNLRDRSLGPVLIERLAPHTWPPEVEVEAADGGGACGHEVSGHHRVSG